MVPVEPRDANGEIGQIRRTDREVSVPSTEVERRLAMPVSSPVTPISS